MVKEEMMDKIIQYQMREIKTGEVRKFLNEYTETLLKKYDNSSFIQKLIEKYENKVKAAENLKHKGTGSFSDVPTQSEKDRLDVRIYERKSFIEDLRSLLDDNSKNL